MAVVILPGSIFWVFENDILKGVDHSSKSCWAVISCDTVYYAEQVVLIFKSMDGILKWDHANESYWKVLSSGAVY